VAQFSVGVNRIDLRVSLGRGAQAGAAADGEGARMALPIAAMKKVGLRAMEPLP